MTDAELIARLREYREINEGSTGVSYDPIPECLAAADRIEALIAERDEYHSEAMTYIEKWGAARKAQDEAEAKLAKAHKDGSQLAAWQCLFDDGKTGIVCDDWGNQYCAMQRRADRAEAALAAQIEVDAGVDPEKFLELVIYAAKEAREKALREAVQVLTDEIDLARIAMPQVVPILSADRKAILALIEKPQCV